MKKSAFSIMLSSLFMKKRILITVYLIIMSLSLISAITTAITPAITGETITGRASSRPTNVSIFISSTTPTLEINKPDNKTYIYNESLLLEYDATNADSVWYNLDNGENTTLTSWIYFNTTEGSHTLWLYANSSTGNLASANVTFAINSDMFTINYTEWENMGEMNYTNFQEYSYEEMENLSNFYLEHQDFGKFLFSETINLTNDENPNDNVINIDEHMNVSFNRIYLNSSALPNFNGSATLYLYNLTFTNPRLVMNGEVCPASICTENSYSNQVLQFTVTHFTEYKAEETPSDSGTPSGGGGGVSVPAKKISLDKSRISIFLKKGDTKQEKLTIKNTGDYSLKISITDKDISQFIKISETDFELNIGESKTIEIDFLAKEESIPDLYLGKIIIKADNIEEQVLIALEVESQKPLFDVKLDIPKKYLQVAPGEEILIDANLFSAGKQGKVDVNVEYQIKNEEGNIIISESETIAVEEQKSFTRSFTIPEKTEEGTYIAYVKVGYNGETASASAFFQVGKKYLAGREYILLITILVIILSLAVILIELRAIKNQRKIDEKTLAKYKLIKRR